MNPKTIKKRGKKSQTKERRESQYIVQSINDAKSHLRTMGIEFHSLLRILLISPVRIIWFAAETCGLRLRAKIMNAFIGRLGVPSELSDCVVRAWCMSFFFTPPRPFHFIRKIKIRFEFSSFPVRSVGKYEDCDPGNRSQERGEKKKKIKREYKGAKDR